MERFVRSWRIFRKAESLLCERGPLAAFPAVSFGVMAAAVLILTAAAILILGVSFSPDGQIVCSRCPGGDERNLAATVFVCLLYLTLTFAANFCSAAFYSEIFLCLKGEKEVSIARGFRFAAGRILPLALWSILSSTVGLILRFAAGRRGRSWLSRTLWFAWSVASCFAIPVLVSDPALVNPFRALKRSGEAINRTWGEALIGFAGLKILLWAGLAAWIFLMFGLWAGVRAWPEYTFFFAVSAAGGTILLGIFAYLVAAAETVYRAALFLYAEEGIFPGGFESGDLNGAFLRQE